VNESTYQQALNTIAAGEAANQQIIDALVEVAEQAAAAVNQHPAAESIRSYLRARHDRGDKRPVFLYDSHHENPDQWSRPENDDFILRTQETCRGGDYVYYVIPAAWVFAEGSERAKLIQAELARLVAEINAREVAKEAEEEEEARRQYEALKERFEA